jgi:hypothetical protein
MCLESLFPGKTFISSSELISTGLFASNDEIKAACLHRGFPGFKTSHTKLSVLRDDLIQWVKSSVLVKKPSKKPSEVINLPCESVALEGREEKAGEATEWPPEQLEEACHDSWAAKYR